MNKFSFQTIPSTRDPFLWSQAHLQVIWSVHHSIICPPSHLYCWIPEIRIMSSFHLSSPNYSDLRHIVHSGVHRHTRHIPAVRNQPDEGMPVPWVGAQLQLLLSRKSIHHPLLIHVLECHQASLTQLWTRFTQWQICLLRHLMCYNWWDGF